MYPWQPDIKMKRPTEFPHDTNDPKRPRSLQGPSYLAILEALDQVDLSTDELHHLSKKISHLYSLKSNKIVQPFPTDLWNNIFQKAELPRLPLGQLLPLRTVCQTWNKVIGSFTKLNYDDVIDPTKLLKIFSLNALTVRLSDITHDFNDLTGLKSLKVTWGSTLMKAESWSHNMTEFAPLTGLTKLSLCTGHITSLGPLTSIQYLSLKTILDRSEVDKLPNLTRLVSDNAYIFSSGRGMWKGSSLGLTYDGEWDECRFHGQGTLTISGDRYDGQFKNGKKDGYGKYCWANGDEYEGGYLDGIQHGLGIYRHANGDVYEGPYVHGVRRGIAVWTFDEGLRYEGEFDEEPCGVGKYITPWGDILEGTFGRGGFEGEGSCYFADGGKYVGTFGNPGYPGKGTWEYANGDVYTGHFNGGDRCGFGVLKFANGNRFEGDFCDCRRTGIMYYVDGRTEQGEWPDDPHVDVNWLEHVEKLKDKWQANK